MNCYLVVDDWRRVGTVGSIYSTERGVELSMGELHSGTTFEAELRMSSETLDEIKRAWEEDGSYPVFSVMLK